MSSGSAFRREVAAEEAFARLVAEHERSMLRVAYVIARDEDVARDAVQAAWAIAWRRVHTLRDPDLIGGWLVTIAANQTRSALRRRRRRARLEVATPPEITTDDQPAGQDALVDLESALGRLEHGDRLLLALRYVAGLESAEIAGHLGISASGVRSRLARLRERLRVELGHG